MLYNENLSGLLIGCLLKQPQLLLQPQYPLCKDDFEPCLLHQILYLCLQRLVKSGVQEATEIEIENVVKNHPVQMEVLQDNNYFDFIATMKEFAVLDNYEYYYTTTRKFSLLRDMKTSNFDITPFYDEMGNEEDELAKLERTSIQEILGAIELDTIQLRAKYDTAYVRDEMKAGEDTDELLEVFKEKPAFGAYLQSPYLSTLWQGWCRGHLLLRSAASGLGKAVPNDTIIPTPNGWKRVDEIHVGDYLYDRHGKSTKVLGVFPQGDKEVWELTLKDGRKAKCCEDHLWTYWYDGRINGKNARKLGTKTLKEIVQANNLRNDKGWRYSIPNSEAVQKPSKDFKIPPYIFGLFLGDGSFREQLTSKSFSYSAPDTELPNVIANTMGWIALKNSGSNYTWSFKNHNGNRIHVSHVLKDYPELIGTYSGNKYIPQEYLEGSIEQRFDLLRGLLDTDGHIAKNGGVSFTTTSLKMFEQVIDLCRSLGIEVRVTKDKREYKYKSGFCGIIHIMAPIEIRDKLFSYSLKVERLNKVLSKTRHNTNHGCPIVKIECLGYKTPMTCFVVDNPEHLFLMNDYIVTHNSRMAVGDLIQTSAIEIWDDDAKEFLLNNNYQGPGFFIHTEMNQRREIAPMFLAAISGVEYKHITQGKCTHEEELRVKKAGEILLQSNITLCDMPDFTNRSIERKIKELAEREGCTYGVFDYVQLQGALAEEYKATTNMPVREDLVLKNAVLELKNMAERYNIGIMSMTQLNDNWKTSPFPDESCLSGSKAMKVKLDGGSIVVATKERQKELRKVESFIVKRSLTDKSIRPNVIEYIYKSRFGEFGDQKIKIWSYFDRGTFRRKDFFCTDVNDNFVSVPKSIPGA